MQLLLSGELNAYDVLCNDWVVFARYNLPGTGSEVTESDGSEMPAAGETAEAVDAVADQDTTAAEADEDDVVAAAEPEASAEAAEGGGRRRDRRDRGDRRRDRGDDRS